MVLPAGRLRRRGGGKVCPDRRAGPVARLRGLDAPAPAFYTGNVTYHCKVESDGAAELLLGAGKFAAPVLNVTLDGRAVGPIAFAPFAAELGAAPAGAHDLDITAYGNRFNAFGCLHNVDDDLLWVGPPAWRSTGDDWAYEYQLRPAGLLVAPTLFARRPD